MHEEEVYKVLKNIWQYDTFRPFQKEAINLVLNKKDCLILMPTSGGKSLCYQLPVMVQNSIGIVISPLIALMEDQVQQLQNKGVKAIALTGQLNSDDIIRIFDNMNFGNYNFLYLSPERLNQDWIIEKIITLNPSLLVIDEAHCVSEWGHDFRPAYLKIHKLRNQLVNTTCMALTATATQKVQDDILKYVGLKSPEVIKMSFKRENITYNFRLTHDKFFDLEKVLKPNETTIIYTSSRKICYDLAKQLELLNLSATFYHGGLSVDEKNKNMSLWMSNQKRIMVATNAFGMGIDKSDVRTVVHYHIPLSIENYYQETGRAGRDGQESRAILLFTPYELEFYKKQSVNNLPTFKELLTVYKKISNYFQIPFGEGFGEIFAFNILDFCKIYDFDVRKVFSTLLFLNNQSIILFETASSQNIQLKCLIDSKQMIRFLSLNVVYENLIMEILRKYTGIFEQFVDLNVLMLSKAISKTPDEITYLLKQLNEKQIVELRLFEHDSKITFLEAREDEYTINKTKKFFDIFIENKINKTHAMYDLIYNNKQCKSEQILSYFGETNIEACGNCNYCLNNPNINKILENLIIKILKQNSLTLRELQLSLDYDNQLILNIIENIFEREIILMDDNHKFYINK